MYESTDDSPSGDSNSGNLPKHSLDEQTEANVSYPAIQFTDDLASLPRLHRTKTWWKLKLRAYDDEDDEDWWVASTAIPLLAATIGPLANVMSISALVVSWRSDLTPKDGSLVLLAQLSGASIPDPRWCYDLNLASLVCGYVGNVFLLLNFTNRIRYIIALPVTIILWYLSAFLLIGIELAMVETQSPAFPNQIWSQGFWYGVISAVLYMICAMILMINMLGYFLGHYPQHFTLTDAQRTLILQTMLFFIWLAGGAGVFSTIESTYGTQDWDFNDALYFCQVTITTIGYGDEVPSDNVGRGLVFPYAVGGIIMLGLMISSISQYGTELSSSHVVRKHADRKRIKTVDRSMSKETEQAQRRRSSTRSGRRMSSAIAQARELSSRNQPSDTRPSIFKALGFSRTMVMSITPGATRGRKSREHVLREEKDRFDAMRAIQKSTMRFKHYTALTLSVGAFVFLWAIGAVVFWQAEKDVSGMTYFEALYYCYVSLLTIGYGDFAPKSAAGRPFFVVWSLLAVPTMTILVSDLGSTVIAAFKNGTNTIGDFTLLPRYGIWHEVLQRHPWLKLRLQHWGERRAARKRVARGFGTGPDPELPEELGGTGHVAPSLDMLASAAQQEPDEHELARALASAIRRTASDLRGDPDKQYGYEEWAEYTRLIRFSAHRGAHQLGEDEEGLLEWDWIGDDSPMMADQTEPEFLLDRLCESMARYIRKQTSKAATEKRGEPETTVERRRGLWSVAEKDGDEEIRMHNDDDQDHRRHHDKREDDQNIWPADQVPMPP